jgi:hypothetical protein
MAKPQGVISPDEATKLDQAFTARHDLISNNILKRADNRSCWWSLQDMKDYLEYAEAQVKELGHEMTGVRVYMGAYGETKEGPGYSTMFMVPTANIPQGKGDDGENADVPEADALNKSNGGKPPSANYPQH